VAALNAAWAKHHSWYTMKIDSTKGTYYEPSCTGKIAKQLTKTAAEGDPGWIEDVGFEDEEWVKSTKAVWVSWWNVLHIGRLLEPTVEQQQQFGPLCRKLYRYPTCPATPSPTALLYVALH
jgi:hypothetical protein